MADILIPIALSSQLDVTGEERIHAAGYSPIIRPVYVQPPQPTYVAVTSDGKIARSFNGIDWELVHTTAGLYSVGFGGGKFLSTVYTGGAPRAIINSTDGGTWSSNHLLPPGSLGGGKVAYGAGMYVCGALRNECYISPDTENWSIVVPSVISGSSGIIGVGGNDTRLVIGDASNAVLHSTNGTVWASVSAGISAGADIHDCIYDGVNWVICAGAGVGTYANVRSSTDLTNWTTRFVSSQGTYAITHGNGVYITGTNGARIYRSVGFGAFTQMTTPLTYFINDVEYGNGVFLAAADHGELAYSLDQGVTWSMATTPFGVSNIIALAYGVIG